MAIENVPLKHWSKVEPIGEISIFDSDFEDLLISNAEWAYKNRRDHMVNFEFGTEIKIEPSGIRIVAFALIPVPAIPKRS